MLPYLYLSPVADSSTSLATSEMIALPAFFCLLTVLGLAATIAMTGFFWGGPLATSWQLSRLLRLCLFVDLANVEGVFSIVDDVRFSVFQRLVGVKFHIAFSSDMIGLNEYRVLFS
jgi:hypothetical protein